MEKMTIKQALEQGYSKCGYEGRDWQTAMNIKDLDYTDFEGLNKLVLFDKEMRHTTISPDQIKDMVADRVEEMRLDETADDTNQCYDAVQAMSVLPFQILSEAVNRVLEETGYYNLTEIELIP